MQESLFFFLLLLFLLFFLFGTVLFSLLLSPPGNRARKKNVIRSLAGVGAARAPWHRAACRSPAVSGGQRPPLRAHIPPSHSHPQLSAQPPAAGIGAQHCATPVLGNAPVGVSQPPPHSPIPSPKHARFGPRTEPLCFPVSLADRSKLHFYRSNKNPRNSPAL